VTSPRPLDARTPAAMSTGTSAGPRSAAGGRQHGARTRFRVRSVHCMSGRFAGKVLVAPGCQHHRHRSSHHRGAHRRPEPPALVDGGVSATVSVGGAVNCNGDVDVDVDVGGEASAAMWLRRRRPGCRWPPVARFNSSISRM
jgi:hypothetical protein